MQFKGRINITRQNFIVYLMSINKTKNNKKLFNDKKLLFKTQQQRTARSL